MPRLRRQNSRFGRNRHSGRQGFTLAELLVSIAILMAISTLAIINFRSAEYGDELRYAAQNLASEIRRAQTFSLINRTVFYCSGDTQYNGSFCPTGNNVECGSGVCLRETPPGGYGVHIDTNSGGQSVQFFADTGDAIRSGNNDHKYQDYELMRQLQFAIGQNVVVDQAFPSSNGIMDVSFMAPRPLAWFNGAKDQSIGQVILRHRKTGNTVTITINGISGQVSVD